MGKLPSITLRLFALALVALPFAATHAQTASFQGVGSGTMLYTYSEGYAVSGDGSTVVGTTADDNGDPRSFRWTQAGGMELLPPLGDPGFVYSEALAVSYDGSVVAGWDYNADGPRQGYRWTQAGGMQAIPYISPESYEFGRSNGISGNGLIIAGSNPSASVWTSAGGTVAVPNTDEYTSEARAISIDGTTVAGSSPNGDLTYNPFRWRIGDPEVTFIEVPTAIRADANGISSDGSVVVGEFLRDDSSYGAFAAGLEGPAVVLDSLDPNSYTGAYAVSGNGLWAVGESAGVAVLWDLTTSEVFDLKAYLIDNYDLALQLDGWTLLCAQGISDNGLVITGTGTDANGDTQAFMAAIPEPSTYALLALAGLAFLVFRRRPLTLA